MTTTQMLVVDAKASIRAVVVAYLKNLSVSRNSYQTIED